MDAAGSSGGDDRAYWVALLSKMAEPVLDAMSKQELKARMPIELSPLWDKRNKDVAYMECIGRLLAGIAPWLALPDDATAESAMRSSLRAKALRSLAVGVDPASPDYLLWEKEGQPLVDAAYIANGFLRAPDALWQPLDQTTRDRYVRAFSQLRRVTPPNNNWLIFAAMKEAFLLKIGADYSPEVIDTALQHMESWYVGDGWYSDGPRFHFDYYNSYVIQPMLVDVLAVMVEKGKREQAEYDLALKRMQRYATYLERFISPEGTYPPFGRSATYRMAVFQPLGQLSLMEKLPDGLPGPQVRSALTAVMKRMFGQPGIFNAGGWLQLGFAGHQPGIADYYSNSGSMYLTSLGFLSLGLPATHAFWTGPFTDWTQCKAWSGQAFSKDYAVDY
jgi:hypothetical protein